MSSTPCRIFVFVGFIVCSSAARAQVVENVWLPPSTGSQSWHTVGNWNSSVPDSPLSVANLSVALGADLAVSIGDSDLTLAGLTLGGSAGAVRTEVQAGTGILVFQNDDAAFNAGNALIVSHGVPGATNIISADVRANAEKIEFGASSTNNIEITGDISFSGAGALRSYMPAGVMATVSGNVNVSDPNTGSPGTISLNDSRDNTGSLEISGVISGVGQITIGPNRTTVALPLSTVILSGNNTFSGRIVVNRANIVLANDNALGTGDVLQGQPSNEFGFNFLSDNDGRTISIPMTVTQWQTVRGDHSLTWNGDIVQDNTRGLINLLSQGKQLTLGGDVFPVMGTDVDRIFTIDGNGRTVVSGALRNHQDGDFAGFGSYRFRGTGVVVLSAGGDSTYSGTTLIEGSNVHFATDADLADSPEVVSVAGAVGVDTGTLTSTLIGRIADGASGGLMLADSEANATIDFAAGDLIFVPGMSVAAPETGITYTGTINPANSTYRLGGGSGTILLPNDNQLTGARNLIATNGGTVHLTGTNDYTGTTSAVAKYITTYQEQAAADENSLADSRILLGTAIAAEHLGNGGLPSSIGSAPSDAANIYLHGSKLSYVGNGDSTDRLFTIGTAGATLDSSGSGPIRFTNAGSLSAMDAAPRSGELDGAVNQGRVINLERTDDLLIGMSVTDSCGLLNGAVITEVISSSQVQLSSGIGSNQACGPGPIAFGSVAKTFTLSGSNSGMNVLTPVIADSENGVVHVEKTGAGTWVLGGENLYSGTTTVKEGQLIVTGATGTGDTVVESSGRLAGTGLIRGNLSVDGVLAPGTDEDPLGTLHLATGSDATIHESGTLALQLGDGITDQLDALGSLTVNGATLEVAFVDGYSPADGTVFEVLMFASAVGSFGNLVLPGGEEIWDVTDLLVNGSLTFLGGGVSVLAGDYNGNGTVDAADYTVWKDTFSSDADLAADGNGNGMIDAADYTIWKDNFGNTRNGVATVTVPEPASAVLAIVALLALVRRAGGVSDVRERGVSVVTA
ncbi:MAG: autotransporter-associated beta strand repeat-containing protein [Pirellulaceae bacterium]|nr:autotransporter-associated beta strand repeat-containing protein [Planctomycetales bacterium]